MENKAIQIEPKAATEMQSWTNIYDRVPSQYRQYVSYPTTTMKECPSKAEINSKLTHACTTDSNELTDYSSIKLNFSEREEFNGRFVSRKLDAQQYYIERYSIEIRYYYTA